jgi:hypothetical protein
MKPIIAILVASIMLSGCNRLEERSREMRYKVDNEYDKMRYKLSGYLYDREETAPEPQAPLPYYPAQYCYKLPSDVICYRKPQPRLKGKFIGMQGEDNAYFADTPVYDDAEEVVVNEGWNKKDDDSLSTEALKRQAITVQDAQDVYGEKKHTDETGPIELMPSY